MKEKQWVSHLQMLLLSVMGGIALGNASLAQELASGIEVLECAVRFADEVEVPAMATGRVAEVHVAANDSVNIGAPIARLDDTTLMIQRGAATVRLNAAKSIAADKIELRYAKTAHAEAKAEYDLNREIDENVGGSIARQRMRQLSLAVERGELEIARAENRTKQAQVEVTLRESDAAVLDDQLRNLHSDSPISGIVLDVSRSRGEWIEKGQSVATIARIDRLHVHALLSSNQIAPIACRDLPVSVHWKDPTGAERSLRGRVLSVDPQLLPDARFRLHAEIINRTEPKDSSQWQLKPGTEVRMVVHVGERAERPSFESLNR